MRGWLICCTAELKLGCSRYVPETLIAALTELEAAYKEIVADPSFKVGLLLQCSRSVGHRLLIAPGVCCFCQVSECSN